MKAKDEREVAHTIQVRARGFNDRGDGTENLVVAAPITASAGHHGHSSPRGDGTENIVVVPPPAKRKVVGALSAHAGRDMMLNEQGLKQGHLVVASPPGAEPLPICIQDVRGSTRDNVSETGAIGSVKSDRDTGMGVRQDGKSYTLGVVERHGVAIPAKSFTVVSKWAKRSGGMAGSEHNNLVRVPPLAVPIDLRSTSRGEKMTNNRRDGSSGGPAGTGVGDAGDPAFTVSERGQAVTVDAPRIAAPVTAGAPGAKSPAGRRQEDDHNLVVTKAHTLESVCKGQGYHPEPGAHLVPTRSAPARAIPIQDARTVDKEQGGVGVGNAGDPMYTVDVMSQHAVAVPVIAIHADATRGGGGAARTPSPDAGGKSRLRDPGLGVDAKSGKQFSLTATSPHIVGIFQQSSQKGSGTVGFEPDAKVSKPVKTQSDGQMIVVELDLFGNPMAPARAKGKRK